MTMLVSDVAPYLLAALGVAGILSIVGWSLREISRSRRSKDWPTYEGEVLHSQVSERNDEGSRMYSADIRYRYLVDGKEFISDRIYFGGSIETSWPGSAWRLVRQYPAGVRVLVYVSPDNPEVAVLEPGPKWHTYYFLAIAAAVIGTVVGFVLLRGLVQ